LISADVLAGILGANAAQPAMLDVRWELGGRPGVDAYNEGHIPGAAFVDLETALAGPPGAGGRHPLPSRETFAAAMRAAGVRNEHPVVAYDAASSMAAARAWWLLRYFGHADVAVLDGGLAAWVRAGQPLQVAAPHVPAGDFVAAPGAMPLLDAAAAASVAERGVLLDARAPERFRGEREPIDPVAGHIPGARNLPGSRIVEESGRFLSPTSLRARFRELGIDEASEVGAYCGSGVTAAQTVLALELAGYSGALYAGSWSEWIVDPSRPVATGG
jgi:thiosulfate/3-mercaptopyruvate sulfurtransferase